MAESCIVCLGDLYQDDPGASTVEVASTSKSPLRDAEGKTTNPRTTSPPQQPEPAQELIAHLLPCHHYLHDVCLKPWVERANSCPVCRQTFNVVEVTASVKGIYFRILSCLEGSANLLSNRPRHNIICGPRQTTSCGY
jgi:hypothetical protein